MENEVIVRLEGKLFWNKARVRIGIISGPPAHNENLKFTKKAFSVLIFPFSVKKNLHISEKKCTFAPRTQKQIIRMSEKELHSYRLSSLEDPTDEQLFALMEQVGDSIHASTQRVTEIHHQHLQEIANL